VALQRIAQSQGSIARLICHPHAALRGRGWVLRDNLTADDALYGASPGATRIELVHERRRPAANAARTLGDRRRDARAEGRAWLLLIAETSTVRRALRVPVPPPEASGASAAVRCTSLGQSGETRVGE